MNEELTDYEKKLISLMENSGRWDGMTQSLTTGLPCLVIIGLGIHYASWIAIIAGVVTYAGIRLWTVWRQDAMAPHISSAIKKLNANSQPHTAPNPSGPVR
jgi:hypothetical protein